MPEKEVSVYVTAALSYQEILSSSEDTLEEQIFHQETGNN
jgi:hypothetical protein